MSTSRPIDPASRPMPARLPGIQRPSWIPAVPDRPWLPPSWGDLLLAAFLSVVTLASVVVEYELRGTGSLPVALVIGLAPAVAVGLRRRYPLAVLAIALAALLAAVPTGVRGSGSIVALIALYTIGTLRPWQAAAFAWVTTSVVGFVSDALGPRGSQVISPVVELGAALVLEFSLYGLATAIGLYMGTRRAYFDGLVERAERLERERELVARQAVADERVRIARELHDVVAHHVSVMVIQAGAAEAVLPPGSTEAATALDAVRNTGREALGEMRRMLDLLRADEPPPSEPETTIATTVGGPESGVRTPQPGLRDLPALASRMRDAGLDVELALEDVPWSLPATIDLSAFRIVQEALTNALRHAGPGVHVRVRGRCTPEEVEIEVADDGRGRPAPPASPGGGHGLVGMRERVAVFGGRFSAGPGAGGGYRVTFTLPIGGAPR